MLRHLRHECSAGGLEPYAHQSRRLETDDRARDGAFGPKQEDMVVPRVLGEAACVDAHPDRALNGPSVARRRAPCEGGSVKSET
jgi:hypothetical protein